MSRCPPVEQLEGFLEESLSAADLQAVSQHVDTCADCQASLENITQAGQNFLSAKSQKQTGMSTPSYPLGDSHTAFLEGLKISPPGSRPTGIAKGIDLDPTPDDSGVLREYPSMAGYEIVSELGRGGMGVVYKARHLGLDRLVALKMILAGPHAGPKDLGRFRQEAEAVARLRHVNIVQVYDIAESEGRPYFALEFIEGGSLAQHLAGTPQPLGPAARLIETLARAIHYAHQRNIVHRDLKPANILLQKEEGRRKKRGEGREPRDEITDLSSFLPKITDFGLAKRLDVHTSGTQSGEVVGTPSYMAPEQATSGPKGVGPASDVYALGAIFYEMLTGRPPFRGPTALDTVLQVLHEEPVRPSHLRPNLPRDLETICLKCLAKEPGKRYANAEKLADDLQRFRQGKPIKARPVGIHERLWKWARHRPLTAALVAGMMSIALVGFGGITWQWQEASRARDDKEMQRQKAENARSEAELARGQEAEQRNKARASLYYSRLAQSQLQWRVNDFTSARDSLLKCIPPPGYEDHRAWEWHYLQGLFHNDLMTLVHPSVGMGGGVAYDPEGRWIISLVGAEETGIPGTVRIWDLEGGVEKICFRGHVTPVECVSFSPDCRRVASLSPAEGTVKVWDLTRHPEHATLAKTDADVEALSFQEEGKRLISVTKVGKLQVWDAGTGMLLEERQLPLEATICPGIPVSFAPGGRRLAAPSRDDPRLVKIWDAGSGAEVVVCRGHELPVSCVTFSGDGRLLATCGFLQEDSRHEIKVWDAAGGRARFTLTGQGKIYTVAFSPDGAWLAYGGQHVLALVPWKLRDKDVKIIAHQGPVTGLAFPAEGQLLASAGMEDRIVKIWKMDKLLSGRQTPWHALAAPSLICDLAFSPDGRRLAAASRDMVKMWAFESGNEVLTLRGAPQRYADPPFNARLAFSPDGVQLAGSNWDESISIWEAPLVKGEDQFTEYQGHKRNLADQRTLIWHLQEAEHCLEHANLPAVHFHLERLGNAPLPTPLQERKERLLAFLKTVPSDM